MGKFTLPRLVLRYGTQERPEEHSMQSVERECAKLFLARVSRYGLQPCIHSQYLSASTHPTIGMLSNDLEATHVGAQHLRDNDAAIGLLIIF